MIQQQIGSKALAEKYINYMGTRTELLIQSFIASIPYVYIYIYISNIYIYIYIYTYMYILGYSLESLINQGNYPQMASIQVSDLA